MAGARDQGVRSFDRLDAKHDSLLDDDGLPDAGYGACVTALDDDAKDTSFQDAAVPADPGSGFFYLMSVIDAQGDNGIGTTSAGLLRIPQLACP